LLTQSGIFKLRGVPTWKLAFLVVDGLIARCSSCLQMIGFYTQELGVSMDRWYFNKDFLWTLEGLSYDWVTKVKRNTVLYRLERSKKRPAQSG